MSPRTRFDLTNYPLPKNAKNRTFFDKSAGYTKLRAAFSGLIEDPGLGVLVADAGVGKTTAIRNLCAQLPEPDHRVLYFCDTAVSPMDLYRLIAVELGVAPSHRRGLLWADIKKALVHLVDERNTKPIFVIDEAQHLSDAYLRDLAGFLNFTFDSRNLLTLWLVGLTPFLRRLRMQEHDALRTRVEAVIQLEPLDRDTFAAAIDHGFKVAGATTKLVADEAMEMLFRSSQGVLRVASKILRASLRLASDRGQAFLDERVVQAAIDELEAAL